MGHCPVSLAVQNSGWGIELSSNMFLCPRPLPRMSAVCLLSSVLAAMVGSDIHPTLPSRIATFGMQSCNL